MDVELINVETEDGLRLAGTLRKPARAGSSRLGLDAVIFHHGVGGNFYNPSFVDRIGDALLEQGCAVLRVNNRGHDLAFGPPEGRQGAAFEIVDDCRLDWRAWVDQCRSLGYERICLWGHSLGAVKTIYYMATERDPRVVCAVATSPPRFSYDDYLLWQGGDEFRATYEQVRQLVDRGEADALVSVTTPTPLLLTARTYLDKYGPGARYNILEHLPNVPVPILVTIGGLEDGISFQPVPPKLRDLTLTTPNLTFELVEGADHQYTGKVDELREAALRWLARVAAPATVQNR